VTSAAAATVKSDPRRDDRVNEVGLTRDLWHGLARARTDNAPRTLAAAQDAVFQRYLPMARTLAKNPVAGGRLDPARAEQAAELGLAEAVLGWRRPDNDGFEMVARSAISCQLVRLCPVSTCEEPAPRSGHREVVHLTS
jgi:hypothetical protein